jgi:S1-C subfamily serine protease
MWAVARTTSQSGGCIGSVCNETIPASVAAACRVADPSGTPLNVRATPNGNIVGTLINGVLVSILDGASDKKGKSWAYVGEYESRTPIGWVYRDFIDCVASDNNSNEFQRVPGQAFRYGGQESFTVFGYEDCERHCGSDPSCVALTFFRSRNLCRPMASIADLVNDADAISGIKIARSQAAPVSTPPKSAPPSQRSNDEERAFYGSGFFISFKGHILTNYHVVRDCGTIAVSSELFPPAAARLTASDPANDLAVLATSLEPAIVPAFNSKVRVGESVFAYGFPLAGLLASTGNFTSGNVVATAGIGNNTSMLQISAPVQPGNSGGPLMDEYGNVVGVIASKLDVIRLAQITDDVAQNVNFAIKASLAQSFLESHGLNPPSEASKRRLEAVNVAEQTKQFTVQVTCH